MGQRRFEQLIEVRGNPTHCAARRTEQQDAGTAVFDRHAARVHWLLCARAALHFGCTSFQQPQTGCDRGVFRTCPSSRIVESCRATRAVSWQNPRCRLGPHTTTLVEARSIPSVKSNWTMGLPSAMYPRILFIGVLVVHLMGAIRVHAHVRGAHEFPRRRGGDSGPVNSTQSSTAS
jgi:hypothetical protein